MTHGYYGRGVYLSYEDTTWFNKKDEGFLVLNPDWFWDKSKDVFNELFYEAINGELNNPRRKKALDYINKILK